ncbi:MAG TPA: alkyl sulfatase dimerization domain-containing protein [Lachnospiraceae bacterium]|nr:alkyl sulfatase dimerization domain-containing protein [Lachnospiraceae bacterium]
MGFLPATEEISGTLVTRKIGDMEVEFQLTPGTEAPAEMNCYLKVYHALWLAENCVGTLHNLYTLRGAQVRDGSAWARYLVQSAELYGEEAEVIFQSHNWPHWRNVTRVFSEYSGGGKEAEDRNLKDFILDTASMYKYINDQTLLYMNEGYKMNEAADLLNIPKQLQKNWCLKPFYGTPKHNAKAVYQKYLGWYDANPLHLAELPPEQLAKELVRYMDQTGSVIDKINDDIAVGNYWTAAYVAYQLILGGGTTKEVQEARILCADAMEQLGYQSESGTWRNAYLAAAYELRNGQNWTDIPGRKKNSNMNLVKYMSPEMVLDYIAILLDGECVSGMDYVDGVINIVEDGSNRYFWFHVRNGAITYYPYGKDSGVYQGELLFSVEKTGLLKLIQMTQSGGSSNDIVREVELRLVGSQVGIAAMKTVFTSMVNLSLKRFKQFDIINPHDDEVTIDGNVCNIREKVQQCASLLERYYTSMKNTSWGYLMTFQSDDVQEWKRYYHLLKEQCSILKDGEFFRCGDDGTWGIGTDAVFRKYEYVHVLYECYRYLAFPYVKNDCRPAQKASLGKQQEQVELIRHIQQEIQMLEPYVAQFYQKGMSPGVAMFDEADALAWDWYYSNVNCKEGKEQIPDSSFFEIDRGEHAYRIMGIGQDGKFEPCELMHFLYQLYRKLYTTAGGEKMAANYDTSTLAKFE